MKNIKYLLITAATLLALGCAPLPIGYYTFLRIAITIIAIVFIVLNQQQQLHWANILMAVIAILFNPIFPIYMDKIAWIVIDALTAIAMIVCYFYIKKKNIDVNGEGIGK